MVPMISSCECDADGSAAIVSSAFASPVFRLRALEASARHSAWASLPLRSPLQRAAGQGLVLATATRTYARPT
jgi:hypothetical protein